MFDRRRQNFIRIVVAVLSGVEGSPPGLEWNRALRTQKTVHAGITVGSMPTGNLVVTFVLESGHAGKTRVEGSRGVASLREQANGLRASRVVHANVEQVRRVQRVSLRVQRVAGVLDEHNFVPCPKSSVVQAGVSHIAQIKKLDGADVRIRRLYQFHDRSEAAKVTADFGSIVRVTRLIEVKLREVRSRAKLSILRSLERRRSRFLGGVIRVEGCCAIGRRVVDRYPVRPEYQVVCVEITKVRPRYVGISLTGVERYR